MTTIISLLNQIKNREIVLPAIQRDFVWQENKIEKLMDSILRGYPTGIVLMWETYQNIQYRIFEEFYKNSTKTEFHENSNENKLTLVLDGQQRLQSLYIALYGRYNGKHLYFDVLSGRQSDDFEEDKYFFEFMTADEAKKQQSDGEEEKKYFHKIHDLHNMGVEEREEYKSTLVESLALNKEDSHRLSVNLAKLDEVLTKDPNILKASVIDQNKPSESKSRQTGSDVLEIFVRINRQGTPLSRSDLIFSMLKLDWEEAATDLPDFVKSINEGNSFSLDVDFVIRCLYAVSDLGTKFDINLLRKKSNMTIMQNNFAKCCDAIRATVDCVQKHCGITNSKVFGQLNLVPFVYYLSYLQNHDLPNDQIECFKKAFFLFGFVGEFSRYADSRLGKFIREALQPLKNAGNATFPFDKAVWWTNYWGKISGFNADLVGRNRGLALHLIQDDVGGATKHDANTREMDHIFPGSTLRTKGFDESQINHFANFWILARGKNRNKSNKHPKDYFQKVSEPDMKQALIRRDMLDYSLYEKFLQNREKAMLDKLAEKTGFVESDFSQM